MPIAWYIVPYARGRFPGGNELYRYTAIDYYTSQIRSDGGDWSETEVLGDRAIVKVRASNSTLTTLDSKYKRLPKDRLDDSLSDLPVGVKQEIKDEILDMGYTVEEIQNKFGNDLGQFTLRDVLKFMTTRRLKPRKVDEDTIVCDGIVQRCRSLESVDSTVQ